MAKVAKVPLCLTFIVWIVLLLPSTVWPWRICAEQDFWMSITGTTHASETTRCVYKANVTSKARTEFARVLQEPSRKVLITPLHRPSFYVTSTSQKEKFHFRVSGLYSSSRGCTLSVQVQGNTQGKILTTDKYRFYPIVNCTAVITWESPKSLSVEFLGVPPFLDISQQTIYLTPYCNQTGVTRTPSLRAGLADKPAVQPRPSHDSVLGPRDVKTYPHQQPIVTTVAAPKTSPVVSTFENTVSATAMVYQSSASGAAAAAPTNDARCLRAVAGLVPVLTSLSSLLLLLF